MSKKLNDNQLKVLNLILNGEEQANAYQKIYTKASRRTAEVKSSYLVSLGKSVEYMEEQRAKLADKHIISREYTMQKLKEVIDTPEKQSDLISAIKVSNEMQGFNAPEKKINYNFDNPPKIKFE